MKEVYLGVDVGSVSTNIAIIDSKTNILDTVYVRTMGKPISAIKKVLNTIKSRLNSMKVMGLGTTGSGRQLAAAMLGADIVKNEITAHGIAAQYFVPNVNTIIEIGGQDSKLILLKNNVIYDFAMNTVCAAGTGSFLDRQAERLGIPIEDFGKMALKSKTSVRIAGRCAVFAESDMIHKQQIGHNEEDIINGLCQALVRNYLNNLAKGKEIKPPIIFQGGVSANIGIKRAFEKILKENIIVPEYSKVMGAIGACILAKEKTDKLGSTKFVGLDVINSDFRVKSFECEFCPNLCEIIEFNRDGELVARWGDKCGRWSNELVSSKERLA